MERLKIKSRWKESRTIPIRRDTGAVPDHWHESSFATSWYLRPDSFLLGFLGGEMEGKVRFVMGNKTPLSLPAVLLSSHNFLQNDFAATWSPYK